MGVVVNPFAYALGGGQGVSAGGVEPDDISGLQLWLDASDLSTITESSGAVSQWDDKSGNGNHVTQGTALHQPSTGVATLNGKNVIEFDADAYMGGSFTFPSGDLTFIAVAASTYDGTEVGSEIVPLITGSNSGEGEEVTLLNEFGTPARALRVVWAGGTASLWLDGVSVSSPAPLSLGVHNIIVAQVEGAGAQSGAAVRVGAYLNYRQDYSKDMEVAEILVYDSALSTTDREAVESYLADRWGITLS